MSKQIGQNAKERDRYIVEMKRLVTPNVGSLTTRQEPAGVYRLIFNSQDLGLKDLEIARISSSQPGEQGYKIEVSDGYRSLPDDLARVLKSYIA